MNNFEIIDDYLANRLPESERMRFEKEIETNAELKAEVEFQRNVIEGIKKSRAAELKRLLKNASIDSTPVIHFSPLRIAASLATVTLLGAAIYLYLNKGVEFNVKDLSSSVADSVSKEQIEEKNRLSLDSAKQTSTVENPNGNKSSLDNHELDNQPNTAKPNIELIDPSEEANEEVTVIKPSANQSKELSNDLKIEIENSNPKYNFHYQFINGQLRLYGNFNSGLYEIIDIKTDNHAVYLYYQDNYYRLDEAVEVISPLKKITDPLLLKKLRTYQHK